MSGIRVKNIPKGVTEKIIRIHFAKPENGGGKIKKFFFPLFNNDAVILYEDKSVVENVIQTSHTLRTTTLVLEILPEHMIFSNMSARLDSDASVLVQATQSLRDEMMFGENIRLVEEADQTYSLHGNWFQLEWAWHYIDCFMQQQEIIQHEISYQTQQYAGTPHEVDRTQRSKRTSRNDQEHSLVSPPINARAHQANHGEDTYLSQSRPGDARSGARAQATDYGDDSYPSQSRPGDARSGARTQGSDYGKDSYSSQSGSLGARGKAAAHQSDYKDRSMSPQSESEDSMDRGRTLGRDFREPDKREQSPDSVSGHQSPDSLSGHQSPRLLSGAGRDDDDSVTSHLLRRTQPDSKERDYQLDRNSLSYGGEGSFNDPVLVGKGFATPAESLTASLTPMQRPRSDDQNQTFQKFSSLGLGENADKRQASGDSQSPVSADYSASNKRQQGEHDRSAAESVSMSPRDTRGSSVATPHRELPTVKNIPAHYSEDQLLASFTINGLKIVLYYGDLREETSDAIVNPANEQLEHYGGLAYLLRQARGREMDEECRRFIANNGRLKTTEVMHTTGGGELHVSHIIHAAGPMWLSASYREKFKRQLTQTFLNCLTYANKRLWIKSLALPTISTGVYGAPLDICVRCFLNAALLFTKSNPESERRLADIRLVNNDAESTVTSIVLVQTLLETSLATLTAEAENIMATSDDDRWSFSGAENKTSSFGSSLRLPRGRPENKSSASPPGRDEGKESSSATRRRSSSLSLSSSKKSPLSDDTGVQKSAVSPSGYDTNDFSTKTKPRPSSVVHKSEKSSSSFSNTLSPSSAARLSQAVTSGTKSPPKIKGQLLPGEPRRQFKDTKPKYSEPAIMGLDIGKKVRPTLGSHQPKLDSDTDSDKDYGLRSLPVDLAGGANYRTKFLEAERKVHICAICLDDVRNPKVLKCSHEFCRSCIDDHFKSKPSCPICGSVYGKFVGNQPIGGAMTMYTDREHCIPGCEKEDGMIVITYKFPDGVQDATHPHPGRTYKGIKRTCYLPNSAEGRDVKRMLKKAFDARLLFTVGDSRTSGKSDVLTWNDVHHKTSITGGPTRFGYPDPTYLKRVKEELAAKGITSE